MLVGQEGQIVLRGIDGVNSRQVHGELPNSVVQVRGRDVGAALDIGDDDVRSWQNLAGLVDIIRFGCCQSGGTYDL